MHNIIIIKQCQRYTTNHIIYGSPQLLVVRQRAGSHILKRKLMGFNGIFFLVFSVIFRRRVRVTRKGLGSQEKDWG